MRRPHSFTVVFTLAAALAVPLLLPLPALAQDDAGSFDDRIVVEEVLLDALVTDRKGNTVLGLGPQDFLVKEAGEPVNLTGVTFYSSSELLDDPGAIAGDIDTEPRDRTFILLFEDQKRNQTNVDLISRQLLAARDAARWIETELAPADWVAVAGFDYELRIYQDFTRDRAALTRAIGQVAKATGPDGNWRSRGGGENLDRSLRAHLPAGKELSRETPRNYDALEWLARASGHIPGRKNLIYFGLGFGEVDRNGIYRQDPRYYPPMARALNDNNVAVYALDITPTNVRHALADSMSQLAQETGGRYFERFVRFGAPLKEVSKENGGYYLLSYRTEHPAGDSGFQKVDVELKDPSLRLRVRKGYGWGDVDSE
ncbi:MAG: VWA domain-containing protein [Acidobacteriota bacterium]